MPSTAARSKRVLSAFGVAATTASRRSENFAKSDHVLPVRFKLDEGSALSVAPSFFASVTTPSSAPVISVVDVGLSTWRSMRTWYAASAVLYDVLDGRSSRCSSAGTSEQAAAMNATSGRSVRRRINRYLFEKSTGRLRQQFRRLRSLRAFLSDRALGTGAHGSRPHFFPGPSRLAGSTCSRRSEER